MQRHRALGFVAGAVLASTAVLAAGQEPTLESIQARRAAALAARANLGDRSAVPAVRVSPVRVVGFAWNADYTPVAYPRLRIRDLRDGLVAANTTGTELGEFRFDELKGGTYLIELVDADDRVLSVGQPLAVRPGETVATFIMLADFADDGFGLAGGTGTRRFGEAAPVLMETAADAQVNTLGGGNAASNER